MKKVLGAMAGIIFAVFSIAILGMLMSFTWGALGKLFPGSFINQLWGMVMFDIAAMCWALAFVFKSSSVGQYAASGIGFVVGFLGTLLMVAAEVIMGGQTFVQNNNMGQYLVYGFVIVTAVHAALIYFHHATAPDIHAKINIGIARGEIETEAIRQATQELDEQKANLAHTIHTRITDDVKRDLNIPIAVDPKIGFVIDPSQVPYPVRTQQPKKESWYSRMMNTIRPPANMAKKEQTVVQQVELQDRPTIYEVHSAPGRGDVPDFLGTVAAYSPSEALDKANRDPLFNGDASWVKPAHTTKENPPAGDAPFPGQPPE